MPEKSKSPSESLPRKVVIGTIMSNFRGDLSERLEMAASLIDEAAAEAARKYPGKGLDLLVLPEHAIQEKENRPASERAVALDGKVLETMAAKARQYRTYMVVPMILLEGKDNRQFTNVGALLDREGKVVGIYRKVQPVQNPDGTLEGGITPGTDFPVFQCDFGKIGIQICFDMAYDEGWLELGRQGAEIVAVPSASPQTVRPSSYALRSHYYVVTSTPRDNATIFDPIGMVEAQITTGRVLVHQIDLAFAILHWAPTLLNGQAFTEAFGDRAGYHYSEREDTGIFWSNDPTTTIGSMVKQLSLPEMDAQIEAARKKQESVRSAIPR